MPVTSEFPITPRDLAWALLRHKRKMFLWSLSVIGIAVAVLVFMPRKYASDAKLFVRLGRESVTLDPTATTGQMVQVQETRENQINSTRDMLTSRALLQQVVQTVGANTILYGTPREADGAKPVPSFLDNVKSVVASVLFLSRVTPEEKAITKLSKSIGVKVGKNTSVIDFSCEAENAELAQQILQAFLDAYHEQHLAANRTAGSLEFFTKQTAQLKEQLDTAVTGLRDAKNESGIVSLPSGAKGAARPIDAARDGVDGGRGGVCLVRGVDRQPTQVAGRTSSPTADATDGRFSQRGSRRLAAGVFQVAARSCRIWSRDWVRIIPR